MAVTSGTYNSTLVTYTAQDIVKAAMQDIRQLPAGGAPTVDDLTDCIVRLNTILKTLQTKGLMLWLYDLVIIPLVQNQYLYTIGPGADIDPGYRPLRAMEGSFLRWTCQPCPNDVALQLLSRVDYLQIASKICPASTPNSFYYDVQMGPSPNPASYNPATRGWGVMYIYPPPSQSVYSAYINVERPIQDITSAGQAIDLPVEWYEPLTRYLGYRIADMFEVPEDRMNRITKVGMDAWEQMCDWGAQEWAPTYFQPDYQMSMRG